MHTFTCIQILSVSIMYLSAFIACTNSTEMLSLLPHSTQDWQYFLSLVYLTIPILVFARIACVSSMGFSRKLVGRKVSIASDV